MKLNGRLSIGELSKATGVKVVTITYYEQIKLMRRRCARKEISAPTNESTSTSFSSFADAGI
jgi:hypothetical protein